MLPAGSSQFPTAKEIGKIDIRKLIGILKKASKGRMGREHAQQLKTSAINSFALTITNSSFALEIRFLVQRMNLLMEQMEALGKQAKKYLKAVNLTRLLYFYFFFYLPSKKNS